MPTQSSTAKQIFALKFLKVVAFVLFLVGTGVSISWYATFVVRINPNLVNASSEQHPYSISQGAKDFSKAAISYGCGLAALWSATQIEQQIKYLSSN